MLTLLCACAHVTGCQQAASPRDEHSDSSLAYLQMTQGSLSLPVTVTVLPNHLRGSLNTGLIHSGVTKIIHRRYVRPMASGILLRCSGSVWEEAESSSRSATGTIRKSNDVMDLPWIVLTVHFFAPFGFIFGTRLHNWGSIRLTRTF